MKQKERLELAQKYVIDNPSESTDGLNEIERKAVGILRICYSHIMDFPLATRQERRDYLVKEAGVTDYNAFNYIAICEMLLGDTTIKGKNLAKIKVQALLDEAYKFLKAENYKGAEGRIKLAQTYIKAFRLDVDEGEMVDAKAALTIEEIHISSDPSKIGIVTNAHWRKEVKRLKKMYGIEDDEDIKDAESEEVKE